MGRRLALRFPLCPLPKRLKHDIKHRDQEDADCACRQHAREYRRADTAASDFRCARGPYQWRQAGDERDRGHHYSAEAQLGAELGRFPDASTLLAFVLGKFDDQNAFFAAIAINTTSPIWA